jgi:hypothetical protein
MTLEPANGSPVLEEQPSPSPSPRQDSRSLKSLFGFGSLPGEEELEELLTGPQPDPEWGSATASGSDEQLEQLGSEQPDSTTSSRGSSASPLLSKGQLKETFRAGVRTSTSAAHRFAARTPGQQHVGLYLADEDDARGIGDPLAEIAYRRGDLAGGKLSPDANNMLQAVMAIAGYIAKQVKGVQTARVLDGQIAAGVVQVDDVDEVA